MENTSLTDELLNLVSEAETISAPAPETTTAGPEDRTLRGELETIARVARFARSGNATLTLVNNDNGKRINYRVRVLEARDGQPESECPAMVSVLTGESNESDYTTIGMWFASGEFRHFDGTWGAKRWASPISKDAPSVKGFVWLVNQLAKVEGQPLLAESRLKSPMKVFHEGRCGRCGRLLTVPASISTGFGPDCAERMGL